MISPVPTAPPAGKSRVVETILRHLLTGRWKGGDRVTEAQVSALIGCSRTPVREALLELAGLGIVELRRNCGAVLQPLGPSELRDLYAVRLLLEVEATRLAAEKLDPAILDHFLSELRRLQDTGKVDRGWKLDQELHGAIAAACGNPRLAGEIERYGALIQTVRETVGDTLQGVHSTTLQEHLDIVEQLRHHDATAAAEAMRRHLAQAADSAVQALDRVQGTAHSQPQAS